MSSVEWFGGLSLFFMQLTSQDCVIKAHWTERESLCDEYIFDRN